MEVSSVWTIDLAYMLYRLGIRGIRYLPLSSDTHSICSLAHNLYVSLRVLCVVCVRCGVVWCGVV